MKGIRHNGVPLRKNRSCGKSTLNPNLTELVPLNGKLCTNVDGATHDLGGTTLQVTVKENTCVSKEDENDTIENADNIIKDMDFEGTFPADDLSSKHIFRDTSDVKPFVHFEMVCKRNISKEKYHTICR